MGRDFDGNSGKVQTTYTTHGTQRSYSIWMHRDGFGEGGLGRVFEKRDAGVASELMFVNTTSSLIAYQRFHSVGTGDWQWAVPDTTSWHHVALTYDAGSISNAPILYVDGSVASISGTLPGGTVTNNADPYVIGNRGTDDRTFDGRLAEFAIWNRILSAGEVTTLAGGALATAMSTSLVGYWRLLGVSPEPDTSGGGNDATVTGTSVADHPFSTGAAARRLQVTVSPRRW